MSTPPVTKDTAVKTINVIETLLREGHRPPGTPGRTRGALYLAAGKLGLARQSVINRLASIRAAHGLEPDWSLYRAQPLPFEVAEIPDEELDADELWEQREKQYKKRSTAEDARKLIQVKVNTPGPIAIAFVGDIHIDNPGCNLPLLREHTKIISDTEGMFAVAVGDLQDAWVGRLARLWAQQGISGKQAYLLAKKWIEEISPKLLAIIWGNHDCVDVHTEAFTRRGWMKHDAITLGDEVLGIDPETGVVSWQKIEAFHRMPGPPTLNRVETAQISLACTDRHRLIHKRRGPHKLFGGYEYARHMDMAAGRVSIPVAGRSNATGAALSDAMIALAGWILTDGTIGRHGERIADVCISQRKSKSPLVARALDAAGVVYSTRERSRDLPIICGVLVKSAEPEMVFRLGAAEARRVLSVLQMEQKQAFPAWVYDLSSKQFDVFLGALIDGDGTRPKSAIRATAFYNRKPLVDELQAVCTMHGYSASIYQYRGDQYRLNICKRLDAQLDWPKTKDTEPYSNDVWCLTVKHGNFLVRRNGKAHFTGNSWALGVNDIAPLEWVASQAGVLHERDGIRLALNLPGGQSYTINARHDFRGRSQYNPAHGLTKANMFGWADDIMVAGHTHETGHTARKNPMTGRVAHMIRCASYKYIDNYAKSEGFPDGNITECPVAIIDPACADKRHSITIDYNPARAASMLKMLRAEWKRK